MNGQSAHIPDTSPGSGLEARNTTDTTRIAPQRHRLRSRYLTARSGLEGAQKPSNGVPAYTRWINRRLARYAAAAAFALRISPNGVTAVSALLTFAGLAFLVYQPFAMHTGVVVAILLAFGYILDSADGQVARLSRQSSLAGEWLDHVVDAVRTPAIHLTTLVSLYLYHEMPLWYFVVPMAFCLQSVGQFMSQILAGTLAKTSRVEVSGKHISKSILLLPTDMGTLCWLFIFWDNKVIFTFAYAILFSLNLAHTAVSMRRKYCKLCSISY